jgi:hypothetical protein
MRPGGGIAPCAARRLTAISVHSSTSDTYLTSNSRLRARLNWLHGNPRKRHKPAVNLSGHPVVGKTQQSNYTGDEAWQT